MNNTMCLGFMLLVLYIRNIKWDYTSEVILVLVPTAMLGVFGATRRSVSLVWGCVALAMYPLALLLQYVLKAKMHLA